MNELQALTCANCGAALEPAPAGMTVTCRYCSVSFRVPQTLTPEPDLGELILGADFRDPSVPGWRLVEPERISFNAGPPPEMVVDQAASKLIHPVLRTPDPFDDFDIGISLSFLEGEYEYVSAGLELRSNSLGDYTVRISAQGTFQIGWHDETEWGGELQKWTTHPILREGFGEFNRMRVLLLGNRMRVYLNGVLAASLRDEKLEAGLVRLVISPSKHGPAQVAFRDLQLRDVG